MTRSVCRAGLRCLLALGLLAGCGDGGGGSDPADESLAPPYINFHEHDFVAHPRWRASGDDLVMVHLESPAARAGGPDTLRAGVDAIPVAYRDTATRTYCWQGDPAHAQDDARTPHSLTLLDAQGGEVLYLAENDPCVTAEIAAGEYSMIFTHADESGEERDILFVLPGWRAALSPTPPADRAQTDSVPDAEAAPAAPPVCAFRHLLADPIVHSGEAVVGRSVIDRGMDTYAGALVLTGPCEDVRLISSGIDPPFPDGNQYVLSWMGDDTFVRVYSEPHFRGARIPIRIATSDQALARFLLPPEPFEFPEFLGYIGSVMPEIGLPAGNTETLIRTRNCDGCDLESVDLHGRDLAGVSLRDANLSHAELSDAILNRAQAAGALFQSANLTRAHFLKTHLEAASFESAGPVPFAAGRVYPAADLTSAQLGEAMLSGASLVGATLEKADFTKAHLDGADLSDSALSAAIFTDATMSGALLTRASGTEVILTRAQMTGANLQGALLPGARMEGAVLSKAVLGRDPTRGLEACQLSDAYMANVDLSSADATGVNLRKARFYGRTATAAGAVLTNADFVDAELSGTIFTGAALQNANFGGATCVNCMFNNARMAATSVTTQDAAKFGGTRLQGAVLTQATVSGCVFTDAIVSFGNGTYSTGSGGDFVYTAVYAASQMGEVTTSANVICPDGLRGPCDTQQRLSPRGGTPTRVPTRTPPPTWTPGGVDPFATPTPRLR